METFILLTKPKETQDFLNGDLNFCLQNQRNINIFLMDTFMLLTRPKEIQHLFNGYVHVAYKTKGDSTLSKWKPSFCLQKLSKAK